MTTQNALSSSNANAAGFPPAPSEALQKADEVKAMRVALAGAAYAVQFEDVALGVLVFWQRVANGRIYVLGFSGKRCKPDLRFSFKDEAAARQHQAQWYARLVASANCKAARRAEKAAAMAKPQTALAVGDVLVASWGYDQTNYDYYQVTRLVGVRSVEIRELAKQSDTTGFMQGDCVPVRNKFKGVPKVKRVNENGSVKVHSWGVCAYKHESRTVGGVEVFVPNHYTAYA